MSLLHFDIIFPILLSPVTTTVNEVNYSYQTGGYWGKRMCPSGYACINRNARAMKNEKLRNLCRISVLRLHGSASKYKILGKLSSERRLPILSVKKRRARERECLLNRKKARAGEGMPLEPFKSTCRLRRVCKCIQDYLGSQTNTKTEGDD